MKLLIVCDPPLSTTEQDTHGTQRAVSCVARELRSIGHEVEIITCTIFGQAPAGQTPYQYVASVLDAAEFDAIHIATQGLLGFLARCYCVNNRLAFTTAHHSQYPEWLNDRHGIPLSAGYAYIRWFHNAAARVIVPTPSMAQRLVKRGVNNTVANLHGVDAEKFKPGDKTFLDMPRPIFLYVGRVTIEKNVEAFAALELPGTKVVVGEGPLRGELSQKYPDARFVGEKSGTELTAHYAAADVFVFPSLTDTFGLVMLEALSAGLPVAAHPVTGPKDVIVDPGIGCLNEDLREAALAALRLSSQDCRDFALAHTWAESAKRFLDFQTPCGSRSGKKSARDLSLPLRVLQGLVSRTENLLFRSEHQ